MLQSTKLPHLPINSILFGAATIILLAFITDISCTKKTQFDAVHHRTKEAETKINELYCFSCDMMLDGDDCLNINKTQSKVNLTKKCGQDENRCSVKRFSYTMSDKNSTSEKRLWSLQRNCTNTCTNACIIIGERVKIHACETCCDGSLCNVGSHGSRLKIYSALLLIIATPYFYFS